MGFSEDVARSRAARDVFLAEHYASPLPEEDQASFEGLDYFAPDEAWRLPAEYEPAPPKRIEIPSSTGTSHLYVRIGLATVHIDGIAHSLAVFDDGDGNVFIPFADDTNGAGTYGGGRYVPLTVDAEGTAWIDFNDAHNPYCAYDDEFVCPLPPASNRITVRIPAGEKDYPRGEHPGS
jgi:uncharacterized protein (DUF1684 family)